MDRSEPSGLQVPTPKEVYRAMAEVIAAMAAPSLACVVNGKSTVAPVPSKAMIEAAGVTPTSPLMTLPVPLASTSGVAPKIAKLCASPSDWASVEEGAQRSAAKATLATRIRCLPFIVNLTFPRPKISRFYSTLFLCFLEVLF